MIVTGGAAKVCVIQVQAARIRVMIGRSVPVRRVGHEAESQIKNTTG